jgi:PadR family transcriptional regulator PadR
MTDIMFRDIFQGFVKLHLLFHAAEAPVFGLELMDELARHGYRLSPGTLYPLLHSLEKGGYLTCEKKIIHGKVRKYYTATANGVRLLAEGKQKAVELLDEISPED